MHYTTIVGFLGVPPPCQHFYPAMLVKTTWLILVGFCRDSYKKRGGVFFVIYVCQNNPNSQGFVVVDAGSDPSR